MAFLGTILSFFFTSSVWAHSDGHLQEAWWQMWNFSFVICMNLALVFGCYLYGSLQRKKRFPADNHARWQLWTFLSGILFLFLALVSPLDPLSDYLGWVHMLQHTILMMIASPLLALSSLRYVNQWVLPKTLAKRIWILKSNLKKTFLGRISYPLTIFWLYTVTLWIWHLPVLYETALSHPLVHDLQHLSFFLTSYFFWILILDPFAKRSLRPEMSLVYLFVSSIHAMILGVLMALSPRVWYEPYIKTAPLFGWDSLEDQQLAGLIMWMPAGITYLLAAVYMFTKIFKPAGAAAPQK